MPGADVRLYILKEYGFTYQMLTYCINSILFRGLFPDSLKFAKLTLVNKKDEATDKGKLYISECITFIFKNLRKKFFIINLVNTWKNT